MACGGSDIMLQLLLVKSGANHVDEDQYDSDEIRGAQMLMDLVSSWTNTNCVFAGVNRM